MTETHEVTMEADVPDDLIPVLEAMEVAGVSRRTIENWINAGHLDKYVKGLNRSHVSRAQLEGLMAPRRVLPGAEHAVSSED